MMNMIDVYVNRLRTYAEIMDSELSRADRRECLDEIKEIVAKLERKINEAENNENL